MHSPSALARLVRFIALFAVLLPLTASAQPTAPDRTVAGVVRDSRTHEPLPGVTVVVADRVAVTDREGHFSLRVPAGPARVELSLGGFYTLTAVLEPTTEAAAQAEFLLVPREAFTSSVDVVASPPPAAAPSAVAVAPMEVLQTPGALDNVFRTLQTLPGVSAADEFGSRIAVRGGAPDQNLTLMDGVEIHDPYRLYGLTSAFNPETISRFELATGGFSVKYGDRLSSLLVVENREGTRRERLDGSASLSVTDANVVLEGKMPAVDGSWLVSARRTYYDLVASRITDQEFPRFSDVQAKGVWELAPGRRVSLFALRSRQAAAVTIDETDARGEFNDDTDNDLVSLRFDTTLGMAGQSHTIVSSSKSVSTFGVDAAFDNTSQRSNAPDDEGVAVANVKFDRTLELRDLSLRQEFSWAAGSHLFEAGGEVHGLGTDLSFVISGDRNPAAANGSSQQGGAGLPDTLLSTRDTTRAGAWLLDRWTPRAGLSLEGGVRLDHSGAGDERLLSPRLNGTWDIAPNTTLRAAVGRYTQSPGYEKLVQGDYVLDLTGPGASRLRSEQATQTSMGLEHSRGSATFRAEAYYKQSSRLLVGQLESDAARQARIATYDFPVALASNIPTDPVITTVPANDGRGRAYGFDLYVARTSAPASARLRGWASYTWGRAERTAYGRTYAFEYDRRHAFSAVTSLRLSSKWEVATTTRVASGFPRTAPLGLRVAGEADAADRDRDGNTSELLPGLDPAGRLVYTVNYGGVANLNNARLPVFARVDLRTTWRPRGAQGRWEMYLEVVNLLNRKNAGALSAELEYNPGGDRPTLVETRDQSIPRFPTVGVRVRF